MEAIDEIKSQILKNIENIEVSDEKLEEFIRESINDYCKSHSLSLSERIQIGKKIMHSMRKLDILQELIDDADISEIMINGKDSIFVERSGQIEKLEIKFDSEEKLKSIIQQIVAKCNRVVNESSPIVDARLSNGSRVNVVLDPVALNGPIMTIRKFPDDPLTIKQLIKIGSLTEETADFLRNAVKAGYNILVSGGTGSGKTTFLNALSSFIPGDERIITIEDSAELQIQGIDNLVRLETKNANVEGKNAITIRDLIKSSLRMRPNRIIVGEVRGAEAFDMICSAMNCGHDGSMSTVHSNSSIDTIARLETMILMAVELPVTAIRRQICSGVDIIIHLSRMRDKSRHVVEISEIDCVKDGEVKMNVLYKFMDNDPTSKKVNGELKKVGEIIHADKFKIAGIQYQ